MNPLLPFTHLVPLAVLLLAGVGWCAWRSSDGLTSGVRWVSWGLRMAGVVGLLALLTNPGDWLAQRAGEEAGWAVMVDASASMATADLDGQDRWTEARRMVASVTSEAPAGAPPMLYTFAEGLERHPDGLEDLSPVGGATRLTQAGTDLLHLHPAGNQDLAGVLWLTDGRETDGDEGGETLALQARARGIPFHAVVLGADVQTRDVSLRASRRHYVTFSGQPVRIGAELSVEGLPDLACVATLAHEDGTVLAAQTNQVPTGESVPVSFPFTPSEVGHYALQLSTPPWPEEHVLHNNALEVAVTVLDGRIRVLLMEGLPHWETKFLAQLLRRQPHIDLTSVHRLSHDRFFRVTGREETGSEIEQPFPDSPDELAAYDVVVFGKGVEHYLNQERVHQLQWFLADHGRSVLFCRGRPYHTAPPGVEGIEAMQWGDMIRRRFVLRPTPAAERAGLSGQFLPAADDAVWERLPPLQQARRIPRLHPFAQVLLEGHPEAETGREFPAVVSRRIGRGLSVAVNAEGLWQWDFFPQWEEAAAFYESFWVRLLQWSATSGGFLPGHAAAVRLSDAVVEVGAPIRLTMEARHGQGEGIGAPEVRVWHAGERTQTIPMASRGGEGTRWVSGLQVERPGAYRLEGVFADTGVPAGEAYLFVRPPVAEGDELSADPVRLRRLCEASGGSLVEADQVGDLLNQAAEPAAEYEDQATWEPAWDRWWAALPLLGVFCAEWVVRRRNGLL